MAQVIADTFGAPVVRLEGVSDSASLGAAYRAAHAMACSRAKAGRAAAVGGLGETRMPTLADMLAAAGVGESHLIPKLVAEPDEEMFKKYTAALPLVAQAEHIIASAFV